MSNYHVIDLHGQRENDAILTISMALMDLESGHNFDAIEFITGQGHVLRRVLEEMLEEKNLTWKNPNPGSYIVYK